MPPLTLAILASVLHIQGSDATITSDNKGVDDLLSVIRGELRDQDNPDAPRIIDARNYTRGSFNKGTYGKGVYIKNYSRYNSAARANPATPAGGFSGKPVGGTHR